MTRGIAFFLCGGGRKQKWRRYLGCLAVSLHSLRQWYDGPVCLLMGDDLLDVDLPLQFPQGITYAYVPLFQGRHCGYVTKATLWRLSPFDNTLLLDCDTVVTGPLDELFGHPFTLVRFSNWITTGRIISGRLKQWESVPEAKELLTTCLEHPYPHVNTGVVAWQRDSPMLPRWERMSIAGQQCSWTDEYAAQLLAAEYVDDIRILDDRFNVSPTYGVHREDARIWHYHGRRYVRKDGPAAMYRPHLLAALEANTGGIADWLRNVDEPLWRLSQ